MPDLSIVIPMKNEALNIDGLLDEITAVGGQLPDYEIIVVDDGSDDATASLASARGRGDRRIRLVRHRHSGGQSAAIHSGVLASTGALIATLDGDGQNPPDQLPLLTAIFQGGEVPADLGLVAGQRVGRQDSWSKRYASRFANSLRRRVLKDGTTDTGCGLKVFRREAYLALPYFDHMHRFLPALFSRDGWAIHHVDVTHRARNAGKSNYNNLRRALVGIPDLIGVAWLIHRRKKVRPSTDSVVAMPARAPRESRTGPESHGDDKPAHPPLASVG